MVALATERDYYAILQINRGARQEAIERAYERLARLYDPALSRKPRAALRWQELNEAYEVLSDKQRRATYDRGVRVRQTGSTTSGSARGRLAMSAFFSSPYFFAGATVAGVLAIVGALVLISVLGGGGGEVAVTQPSVSASVAATTPTATPVGQTPGPTAPASPPQVAGEAVATASGLKYIDLQPGTGASPTIGQAISVQYTGWLADTGKKFDSSIDRGEPAEFVLGHVIEGWNEGLATMQVGGKRRLIIPSALGYGATGFGNGAIPPNADLIFDVELLAIK